MYSDDAEAFPRENYETPTKPCDRYTSGCHNEK